MRRHQSRQSAIKKYINIALCLQPNTKSLLLPACGYVPCLACLVMGDSNGVVPGADPNLLSPTGGEDVGALFDLAEG